MIVLPLNRSPSIMSAENPLEAETLEQPYPLKNLFRRRFVPVLIGFVAAFLLLIGFTAGQIVESIYLELAQRRAQTIARAVDRHAPDAWRELMAGRTSADLTHGDRKTALNEAFAGEVEELNLSELKVYSLDRKVLFATHREEIGTTENGEALRAVIKHSTSEIVTKVLPDGSSQYELYVPVFDDQRTLRTVFELYEPVGYLDDILLRAAIPTIAIPGLLLLLLAFALDRLVNRAQGAIDVRSQALATLHKRIESFVSATAVDAAKKVDAGGHIDSQKIETTLFFSDIRDFTGFAEQNSPEDVVEFLNHLMGLQVNIIKRHGGDVDKMIGDAILARFDSDDGASQAIKAALEIQQAVRSGNFPRALGIGIFRGDVISGAIGPEDRRDFTVIGDSVNISARLCSAALANQIVVDAQLAGNDFGPEESIQVKGRQQPILVRRWINA
jgi:adenylate cyclase